jgi:hypothetical protein
LDLFDSSEEELLEELELEELCRDETPLRLEDLADLADPGALLLLIEWPKASIAGGAWAL